MQRLRHVGVVSLAKVMGAMGLIVGLLAGVLYGGSILLMSLIGAAGAQRGGAGIAALGMTGAVIVAIVLPLAYGFASFVMGLLYGLILNLVLRMAGGLEIEIVPESDAG